MTKTCTFVVFLCGALLGLVLLILTNNNSPNTNAFLFGSCEHAVVNVTSTMNFFEYKTRSTAVRYIVTHSLDQKDVIMSTNQKNVSVQAVLTFVDAAYTIHEGTPHLYPFDKYRVFLTFDIYGSNVTLNNIFIQLSSSLDGWNADAYSISNVPFISPSINGASILIPVTLTRSSTQIVFCLFLYLIMWILSFHAFSMSITIYKSSKEVEAPTIGVVGGLLFALPAIRNSQPGTPTIVIFWILKYRDV
ncbi:hypothetical protein BC833DRAFT_606696 [Globomyces pollinis-pini]|nr:hypothetical protein BC833DRAFT_606696 [Globomyces pollinis-pini]